MREWRVLNYVIRSTAKVKRHTCVRYIGRPHDSAYLFHGLQIGTEAAVHPLSGQIAV